MKEKMDLKKFYKEQTGYPKKFDAQRDTVGSGGLDLCDIKHCENDAQLQLYNNTKKYLEEEYTPIEIICRKHYNQEAHLKFAYRKVRDSNGEFRSKFVEIKS